LFKLLFLGYSFGVRSERQLINEAQVNVAYRWFLGLGLTDKVPDASTLSQNRRCRFNDSEVYQHIFDEGDESAHHEDSSPPPDSQQKSPLQTADALSDYAQA
jgi:hypothetical protein